jgi:hypothetical protein
MGQICKPDISCKTTSIRVSERPVLSPKRSRTTAIKSSPTQLTELVSSAICLLPPPESCLPPAPDCTLFPPWLPTCVGNKVSPTCRSKAKDIIGCLPSAFSFHSKRIHFPPEILLCFKESCLKSPSSWTGLIDLRAGPYPLPTTGLALIQY